MMSQPHPLTPWKNMNIIALLVLSNCTWPCGMKWKQPIRLQYIVLTFLIRLPMVSMTAIINAIAAASLLAPNDKSLKNAVESNCKIMWDHVMLCEIMWCYVRSCDAMMLWWFYYTIHRVHFPRWKFSHLVNFSISRKLSNLEIPVWRSFRAD